MESKTMNNVVDMRVFRLKRAQAQMKNAHARYKKGLVTTEEAGELLLKLHAAEDQLTFEERWEIREND